MADILAGDFFKYIFLNENDCVSLKFVPCGVFYKRPTLAHIPVKWWTANSKPPETMTTQFTDGYMRHMAFNMLSNGM